MGKGKKLQPVMLPAKLGAIRRHLGLTQEQMVRYIVPDTKDPLSDRAAVSDYESARRTPSPLEVFYYAKAVRDLTVYENFSSDDLLDDACKLPFSPHSKKIAAGEVPLGKINSRQKNKEGTESGKDLMIVGESGGAECSDKETSDSQSLGILTLPGMGSSENSATDFVTELTVAKEHDEDEIDYPRRFYFSFEFIEKFDNFMMRLLLATPYRFREHYCDSSLSIEIAVLAALRDLERMDRENVQSVVVECLHEHIADHYEN
jgi:transcriptional regulator with XRE-family HTH domain